MCGIFGFIVREQKQIGYSKTLNLLRNLYLLSESRGKESSGISIKAVNKKKISVLKKSVPASEIIKKKEYKVLLEDALRKKNSSDELHTPFYVIAHARLVTNGTQENNNNNQPVIKDDIVAVHNGIITNVNELWNEYRNVISPRQWEVDTEIFLSLFRWQLNQSGKVIQALRKTFETIEGTASIALQPADFDFSLLATNNGSLYYVFDNEENSVLFASEEYILREALRRSDVEDIFNPEKIQWMKAGEFVWVDLKNKNHVIGRYHDTKHDELECPVTEKSVIENLTPDKPVDFEKIEKEIYQLKNSPLRKLLEYHPEAIRRLKRCRKCVLPETFPYIWFDENGICNYCHGYIQRKLGSRREEFLEILEKFRRKDGKPDCLVPFSGGRDSSFGLHYIVRELGMHPITYTYDWGMVTDLARRNIARLCGKLGIENIIVSADIHQKRRNIRLNVEAWLKNPKLGLIPLFMAGDKQFFYYVNKIKKQTGIPLDIWCTNYLENTDFKVGFCHVEPTFDKHRPDYLPFSSKVKMAWYYLKNFLVNPAYLNSSIWDTIFSFYAYYAEPRVNFYQLYDWVRWDEKEITETLLKEYNWELSPDTTSSWRIGDGTSAFYNYIYYTVAGFSEIETFRSNQIREGLMSREEALEKIYEENRPRFESLKWYLDTIGVDFERAVRIINQIPKRYKLE